MSALEPQGNCAAAPASAEQKRTAEYLAPDEAWERRLVKHLDQQPRSQVLDISDTISGFSAQECHYNIEHYRSMNSRAVPVLGWLQDKAGYVLHSVVEIDGQLCDVTPLIWSMPFVRDPALELRWETAARGGSRAIITREARVMPVGLRTAKDAQSGSDGGSIWAGATR